MTANGFAAAAASISTVAPIRIGEKSAKLGYCLRLKQVNSWILWRVNICCVKLIVRLAVRCWIRIWSRRMRKMDQEGPNRPQPQPLSLETKTTAILVLDLSSRCENPKEVCFQLMEPLGKFLERARQSSVPILFTISASAKGTPLGEVAKPLKRRQTEPILYPDAFDKFMGGELQDSLKRAGCRSLVIVGSATNFAVLYTATTAARIYRYDVIVPLDGVNAKRRYEHEYAIHQLTILPASAHKQFRFTTLGMIEFD